MRKKLALLVGVCAAVAATTTAVAATTGSADHAPGKPKVVVADAENLLPSATAADWVTYGDHLVVVTLTGEQAEPATAEEIAAGEGFIPRDVSVHVDKVLWSRPDAPAAPATMDWSLDGWTFHGDARTPLRLDGEPGMAVGDTYVVPVTYLSQTATVGAAGWSPLSPDSILPYADSTLGSGAAVIGYSGPASDPSHETAVRDAVWGQSVSDLVATLNATAPDAAATPYMNQPPDVRYQKASASDATTG
jgi:hypothetical protein